MSSFLSALRKSLRDELREERAPLRSADASGGSRTQTVTFTVDQVEAAGNAQGTVFARGGLVLGLSPASSAAAVLEVCFDKPGGTAVDNWTRMVPGSRIRRPDGRAFGEFRVRRATGTPSSATITAVFDVDPDEVGFSVEHLGRFPQLSSLGSLTILLRALDLAGNEVDLRCSDEGSLSVSGWDGAAYSRLRTVTPADALAATAGTLDVLARAAGYNGATWDRLRSVTPGATNAPTAGASDALSRLYAWDGASFSRLMVESAANPYLCVAIRSGGNQAAVLVDADAMAAGQGHVASLSRLQGYNGGTWDRLRSVTPADGLAASSGTLRTWAAVALYDGANYDRWRGGAGLAGTVEAARVVESIAATAPSAIFAVTGASTQVRPALATRKSITLYNDGPDNVWVAFGEAATAGTAAGFKIPPGNSYTSESDEQVNAIRDGAAASLYWCEEAHG